MLLCADGKMTSFRQREITAKLHRYLKAMPVTVMTGLRQVGKSTLLQREETLAKRRYLTLDDFATLEAARADPLGLLEGDDEITVDEAQRCPELLLAAKQRCTGASDIASQRSDRMVSI